MMNREGEQAGKHKTLLFYGYVVVAAAVIIRMVMLGPRSSFGVFFKPLVEDFHWSRGLISGSFSISSIIQGLSGIVMGRLNDKLGPRVVMTICGLFIGAGFLLMSLINAPWQLYLFYVVIIGIGSGGGFTPPMSTVARWFVKRRSMMTGIVSAGGGLGGMFLPPAINWLIGAKGWRFSYIALGALVLVVVVAAAQFLKRDPSKMGLKPYGEEAQTDATRNKPAEGLSLKEAVRTRQYYIASSMFFCGAFSMTMLSVHIVPHITDLGISSTIAANVLGSFNLSLLVGGIILGWVADKIGIKWTYLTGFVFMGTMFFWMVVIKDVSLFYLSVIIMGAGAGAANALESPLVAELFGIKSHGFILGTCSMFFLLGSAAGSYAGGYLFDLTGNYNLAFTLCGALGIVGLIMTLTLTKVKTKAGVMGA
jgi:MFS family permease